MLCISYVLSLSNVKNSFVDNKPAITIHLHLAKKFFQVDLNFIHFRSEWNILHHFPNSLLSLIMLSDSPFWIMPRYLFFSFIPSSLLKISIACKIRMLWEIYWGGLPNLIIYAKYNWMFWRMNKLQLAFLMFAYILWYCAVRFDNWVVFTLQTKRSETTSRKAY